MTSMNDGDLENLKWNDNFVCVQLKILDERRGDINTWISESSDFGMSHMGSSSLYLINFLINIYFLWLIDWASLHDYMNFYNTKVKYFCWIIKYIGIFRECTFIIATNHNKMWTNLLWSW